MKTKLGMTTELINTCGNRGSELAGLAQAAAPAGAPKNCMWETGQEAASTSTLGLCQDQGVAHAGQGLSTH